MKPLDCALRVTLFHRFGNLVAERRPVVEWFDSEELDERIQLVDIVLHRSTREAPPVFAFERTTCDRSLGAFILDIMRLV